MNSKNSMTLLYKIEFVFFQVLLSIVLLVCASCGGDDGESAIERTARQLKGEWQLTSLVVDGTDQTNLFPDLVITLANGTYQTANGEPVWPASGTWSITDATTVLRDSDLAIQVESITETSMTLSLVWSRDTFGSRRNKSVSGNHTFQFTKK
jgi:hypothetical protein